MIQFYLTNSGYTDEQITADDGLILDSSSMKAVAFTKIDTNTKILVELPFMKLTNSYVGDSSHIGLSQEGANALHTEVSGRLVDVSTDLIELTARVADISAHAIGNESSIGEVSGRLNDVSTDLIELTARVADISTHAIENESSIGDISTRLSDVSTRVSLIPRFGVSVIDSSNSIDIADPDDQNKIFLVRDTNARSGNLFTEYIVVYDTSLDSSVVEELGTGKLKLDEYVRKDQIASVVDANSSIPTNIAVKTYVDTSVSSLSTTLNTRIANVSTLVNNVSTYAANVSTYASNVSTYAVSVSTNTNTRIANVSTYAQNVSTYAADVSTRLNARIANVSTYAADASTRLNARIAEVSTYTADVSSYVADVSLNTNALITELDGDLTELDSSLHALYDDVSILEQIWAAAWHDINDKVDDAAADVSTLDSSWTQLIAELAIFHQNNPSLVWTGITLF